MLPDGIDISPGFKVVATSSGAPAAAGVYSPGKGLAVDQAGGIYAYITGDVWRLISGARTPGRSVAQTAAVASVAAVTVGTADASFHVSANINVTTATTHNFTVTCAYTDEGNTGRTLTLGFTQLSGATLLTAITNITGAGPYESPVYHIRAKASTTIIIATTGTFTTVTYNAEGIITQVA